MPSWFEVGNIWKTLREIDLRPIRAEAERVTTIAVVGDESARDAFVHALCERSGRLSVQADASQAGPEPITLDPGAATADLSADLLVMIVGADESGEHAKEKQLLDQWRAAGRKVVVIYTPVLTRPGADGFAGLGALVLRGSTGDRVFLEREFVPAVLSLLPENSISLARYYPLFRVAVGKKLIADTSMANASYSLGTGLAEIIPILDVPFNLADIIILTKAQAIMSYKLGLALGLPGNWQEHMTAFGGTLGSGFVFRQVARQLVGLIPVWGIIPKVAVAYAGTYVLGEAILQWYLTGHRVTAATMRQLYRDAFEQGKAMARTLLPRRPRRQKRLQLTLRGTKICANCGATNPAGYNYCGNCGSPLEATG